MWLDMLDSEQTIFEQTIEQMKKHIQWIDRDIELDISIRKELKEAIEEVAHIQEYTVCPLCGGKMYDLSVFKKYERLTFADWSSALTVLSAGDGDMDRCMDIFTFFPIAPECQNCRCYIMTPPSRAELFRNTDQVSKNSLAGILFKKVPEVTQIAWGKRIGLFWILYNNVWILIPGDKDYIIEKLTGTSRASKKQSGEVYLIKANNFYKIGATSNVKRRISEISTSIPFEISIITTITTDDMYKLEASLHDRFSEKRVNGEWFILEQSDVDYICSL